MRPLTRHLSIAVTFLALAVMTAGCGGSAKVSLPAIDPGAGVHLAAMDSLALRGLALDSCSAWRLVAIESQRHNESLAAQYRAETERLANQYVITVARYDSRRSGLPAAMFLPPSESLTALELGSCWV